MNAIILIVEDDVILADGMVHILNDAGYNTHSAYTGIDGLELAYTLRPEIVILDVNLPDGNGKKICRQIKAQEPPLAPYVLLISGVNMTSDEQAEGLEAGADEYAVKPISDRELLARVRLLLRLKRSEDALRNREQTMRMLLNASSDMVILTDTRGTIIEANAPLVHYSQKSHAQLIGQPIHELFPAEIAEQFLKRANMVLESGQPFKMETYFEGKASTRRAHPLVKINCAALPPHLIESELFGHEAGSFTGATAKRIGRFELANQGTLFLDEIGELPPDLQAKLLRVLQEGEFERVGSSRTQQVDVRLVASTNRDLETEIRAGRFRQDLYYRLNVYPLSMPPLRTRPDDIPLLIHAFVQRFCKKIGRTITQVPQSTIDALKRYSWPGNVRELQNLIERSVITTPGDVLHVELPEHIAVMTDIQKTLEDVEYDYIVQVLSEKNWRVSGPHGAACILGLHPETLRSRIKKLGIRKPDSIKL